MTPRKSTPDFESRFLDLLTDKIDDVQEQVRKGFDNADKKIVKLTKEQQLNTDITKDINHRLGVVETRVNRTTSNWWDDRKLVTIIALIVLMFLIALFKILGIDLPTGLFS